MTRISMTAATKLVAAVCVVLAATLVVGPLPAAAACRGSAVREATAGRTAPTRSGRAATEAGVAQAASAVVVAAAQAGRASAS